MYGVGLTFYDRKPVDTYTKYIYNYILRKDIAHSVRDEDSKNFIEKLGYKAVNTGCPTLWSLNDEHCCNIAKNKSNKVVITLSGQKKYQNPEKDIAFLKIISKNYKTVFFWVQTLNDKEYYESLQVNLNVEYIYSLYHYQQLLNSGDIDYIGTRLHGGIFALQNKVRTIILAIDNRARSFKKLNNIVSIDRNNIEELDEMINSKFSTNIYIPENEIKLWLSQFR